VPAGRRRWAAAAPCLAPVPETCKKKRPGLIAPAPAGLQEMGRGGTQPSWLAWMAVALPIACLGNVACWALLLLAYRPGRDVKEVRRLPDSEARARRARAQWLPSGRPVAAHAVPARMQHCEARQRARDFY
jgi:hypothetical protein